MAGSALVDTGFLIALLSRRDRHHGWAAIQSSQLAPPWKTCESVLSETFFLLGERGQPSLVALLRRKTVVPAFDLVGNLDRVLALMQKYADVPMSLADACLVRMSEILADTIILTTDADFRIYRRHGRQIVSCSTPH
jgi:predicted nucleic acid-binding protein